MTKNAVIWIVVVTTLSAGAGAQAQSTSAPLTRPIAIRATPLTDSAERAAIALAQTPIESPQPTPPSSHKSCAKRVAVGAGAGALAGLGTSVGLLMSSGGSDSAGGIMKGFAGFGAILGLMIGSLTCQ